MIFPVFLRETLINLIDRFTKDEGWKCRGKNRKRGESTRCHKPSFRTYFRAKYSGEASLNKRETEKRFFRFSRGATDPLCLRSHRLWMQPHSKRTVSAPYSREGPTTWLFLHYYQRIPAIIFSSAPSPCLLSSTDLDTRWLLFSLPRTFRMIFSVRNMETEETRKLYLLKSANVNEKKFFSNNLALSNVVILEMEKLDKNR